MTPSEMLDAIDGALLRPRGPRGTVLEVTAPHVLGVRTKFLRDSEYGPVYGLTKRGCKRVRKAIYAAAAADLHAPPETVEGTWVGTDEVDE